jgi:hypothetical protein
LSAPGEKKGCGGRIGRKKLTKSSHGMKMAQ